MRLNTIISILFLAITVAGIVVGIVMRSTTITVISFLAVIIVGIVALIKFLNNSSRKK